MCPHRRPGAPRKNKNTNRQEPHVWHRRGNAPLLPTIMGRLCGVYEMNQNIKDLKHVYSELRNVEHFLNMLLLSLTTKAEEDPEVFSVKEMVCLFSFKHSQATDLLRVEIVKMERDQ
jgi:hypothetical protein